ncbi:hypothetical protein SLEP1_g6605 [Rubroshorea leprosula]|uniref:S-acyltransferase n=1 Tax=Rubroshorea leprosula TaxID=152421 RepID=A0AAV5I4P0_9ROSI|nr:hypothetical protein SLEP1_g6605 [Rubroshorea leprosula]
MYAAARPPQLSESNRQIIGTNVPTVRVYEVWKGSNRFCFGGRFIFGPDVGSIYITVSLIVIPVSLFCAFVSHRLIHEFEHPMGILLVAICVIFTVYDITLLLLTSSRDPGIIPRNLHPPEPEDDRSSMSADWGGSQSGVSTIPPTKDIVVNGMIVRVKYCQTCTLYRPPRCSHCSICNNCVERFDHHCPWVGQCIGKRNYRFFFMFVFSTTMLCLYVFAFCWVNIVKIMAANHCSLWRAFSESPVSLILILYTFVTAWFVGGLTSFHLYLIFTNQTTYENFRYQYNGKMNPYNLGCAHNIVDIFFSKIPKSKNNFRAKIKLNSSSILAASISHGRTMSPEVPKTSYDIEMGKRRAVAAEDFEEIQSQLDGIGRFERCGTEPRHVHWDEMTNWEITPEIHRLAAEFGLEHGLKSRK